MRAHMLTMIQTALFHPITGSSSEEGDASRVVDWEPSRRVEFSDWIRGVFSVAVAAVEKPSSPAPPSC